MKSFQNICVWIVIVVGLAVVAELLKRQNIHFDFGCGYAACSIYAMYKSYKK